jgi:hypothetical protein
LGYGLFTPTHGFFPQYFTEFVPPLAIITAALVVDVSEIWIPAGRRGLALALLVGALWLTAFIESRFQLPTLVYVLFGLLALGLSVSVRHGLSRRRLLQLLVLGTAATATVMTSAAMPFMVARAAKGLVALGGLFMVVALARDALPERKSVFGFAVLASLVAFAFLSYREAGRSLSLTYQAQWPAGLVSPVAKVIEAETSLSDEVMSGGVVWEFVAQRHPYQTLSHPLSLEVGLSAEDGARLRRALRDRPPAVIVLDRFTERTYGLHLPDLAQILAEEYVLVAEFEGAPEPVRVFRFRGRSRETAIGEGTGHRELRAKPDDNM